MSEEQRQKSIEAAAQLIAAARRDWEDADPEAITLNGVPQTGWRQAYVEGCQDMATKILTQLNVTQGEAMAAYEDAVAALPPKQSN